MEYREKVMDKLTSGVGIAVETQDWGRILEGAEIVEHPLDGIEPFADLQAVFTASYNGLAKQSFSKSVDNRGCLYNGDNVRCAIGVCLPWNYETTDPLNTLALRPLMTVDNRVAHLFQNVPETKLMALQFCHDQATSASGVMNRLHEFADINGLKIPEAVYGLS